MRDTYFTPKPDGRVRCTISASAIPWPEQKLWTGETKLVDYCRHPVKERIWKHYRTTVIGLDIWSDCDCSQVLL